MLRLVLTIAVVASSVAAQDSDLKQEWKAVTKDVGHSEFGVGLYGERRGQICDPKRKFGQESNSVDTRDGCVVMFISDPNDAFTVKDLPANQQDNFQNTQHYEQAYNIQGKGFLGNSLPRAPQDLNPVCYIANVSGQIVLGYEEGNGDKLLPCPGARNALPLTEEEILAPDADLEDLCGQCYHTVCSGNHRTRPQDCGHISQGGVDIGQQNNNDPYGTMVEQATPAYHCHLTMANEGACDYVQYNQHEKDREYYMNYTVLCGWENVVDLQISHCDCTRVAGTDNGCGRDECLEMALKGVVCGNCGSCNQGRAYESIFHPLYDGAEGARRFDGSCARALVEEEGPAKNYNTMMCSKGLNCQEYADHSGCRFHCDRFGYDSDIWTDEECPPPPPTCTVGGTDVEGVHEEGSDKCFFAPEPGTKVTWAEGEQRCQTFGGHLASVYSEAENDLVYYLYVESGARDSSSAMYMGLSDDADLIAGASEGTFRWSDGGEVDFEAWGGGEPNNSGGNQNCGYMWRDDKTWDDISCAATLPYVCSVGESPEPSGRRRLLSAVDHAPLTLDSHFSIHDIVSDPIRARSLRV